MVVVGEFLSRKETVSETALLAETGSFLLWLTLACMEGW